jgi:hypothetical protein
LKTRMMLIMETKGVMYEKQKLGNSFFLRNMSYIQFHSYGFSTYIGYVGLCI